MIGIMMMAKMAFKTNNRIFSQIGHFDQKNMVRIPIGFMKRSRRTVTIVLVWADAPVFVLETTVVTTVVAVVTGAPGTAETVGVVAGVGLEGAVVSAI